MRAAELAIGATHFVLGYEDDEMTRPIITSYEYLGVEEDVANGETEVRHQFRIIGEDAELFLYQRQLYLVLDISGLKNALDRFSQDKHREPHPVDDDAR